MGAYLVIHVLINVNYGRLVAAAVAVVGPVAQGLDTCEAQGARVWAGAGWEGVGLQLGAWSVGMWLSADAD